jgi:hypothetical protein
MKHGTKVRATTGKGKTYRGTVIGRNLAGKTGDWVIVKTDQHRKGRVSVRPSEVHAVG